MDYEGIERLIFSVKEPLLCFTKKCSLKVQLATSSFNAWDFEISGSFTGRACTIKDHGGKLVAEVTMPLFIMSKGFRSIETNVTYSISIISSLTN